ncbi:MAG: BCCT family transporter, partial [Brachybacterium sp.]|nr:BCCT family transporter [Brachybacterium sp.]
MTPGSHPDPGAPTQRPHQRRGSSVAGEDTYPHGLHPGLVPGISVDRNRVRFGLDRLVFGLTAVLVVAFVTWGI